MEVKYKCVEQKELKDFNEMMDCRLCSLTGHRCRAKTVEVIKKGEDK